MQTYQQIDAEFAQYEAEVAALKQRMDALKERREDMRQQEQQIAIPDILARIAALGITPEQLGYAPQSKKSTAPSIPRYRDPVSGKKHSGKGSLPDWLTPETKKDPNYENPEWTAMKAAKKSKTKTSAASVTDPTPVSADATTSTDASPMANGGESSVIDGSASQTVANAPAIDAPETGSNTHNEQIVSSHN